MTCPQCEEKDAEIAKLREQVKALIRDMAELVLVSAELDRVDAHQPRA
jgi:hypothetical protein